MSLFDIRILGDIGDETKLITYMRMIFLWNQQDFVFLMKI